MKIKIVLPIIILLFAVIVLAELNQPEVPNLSLNVPNLSLNANTNIISEEVWSLSESAGSERNLTLWILNAKNKKTEIGFYVRNNKTYDTSQELCLHNKNGNRFLDDGGNEISCLKYGKNNGKCGGKDCYHISLTNAQTKNNDYIKFGENSIIIKYQNESKIRYFYDWGYTDFILQKRVSHNETILMNGSLVEKTYYNWDVINDLEVSWNEDKVKMEGVDNSMNDEEINRFRYKIITYTNSSWANSSKSQYVAEKETDYKFPKIIVYHENPDNILLNLNKSETETKEIKYPELRHIFDFEDICKNNYSKCEWRYFGNKTTIYFNSKKHIDPTGTAISSCATINSNRYLSGNLVTSSDCIFINANNIALDLNGHYMDGDDGLSDYGIQGSSNYLNFKLEDNSGGGYIRDFGRGIYLGGGGTGGTIEDVDFISNHYGVYTTPSSITLTRSNFISNTYGIKWYGDLGDISYVDVTGSIKALYLNGASRNTISNSNFSSSDTACTFSIARANEVYNTNCIGTSNNDGLSIYALDSGRDSGDNYFKNSEFSSSATGVRILSDNSGLADNNTFEDCIITGDIVVDNSGDGNLAQMKILGEIVLN